MPKQLASIVALILAVVLATGLSPAAAEELPVPTHQNSVIISIEHAVTDTAEIDYIKNKIPWGLYTKLSFSQTVLAPHLAWQSDWNEADSGIQSFKTQLDQLLAAAENAGIYLHPVICSGLARIRWIYRDAKIEDIRNAQWYNDNKLASDNQILDSQLMDTHVFGTLSRYARKMRRNLEAKAEATLNFIKRRMDEKPHVFAIASGWGEVELNSGRPPRRAISISSAIPIRISTGSKPAITAGAPRSFSRNAYPARPITVLTCPGRTKPSGGDAAPSSR